MFTGTAISGSDYTVISDITVPADSTGEYCANISITDDNQFEGEEVFAVILSVTNRPSGVTLDNDTVAITITDNEGNYNI